MAENADVQYTIRADSSQLETDLNQAENLVRQSAERTEEALDGISESAQRSSEQVKKTTEQTEQSTEKTRKSSEETEKSYKSLGEELDEVNKLLEKDSKNTALSAQKKELLKKAIAETGDKLKFLKERQADVNQAYRNGDIPDEEYREFQREIAATEQELQGYQEELSNVGKSSDEVAEKTGSKLTAALSKIGKVAGVAATAVAGVSAAVGTAAVKSADDLDKAVKRVTSATGSGAEAADKYAEVISNVYGDNFGESFGEIADTISTITQNLGEMDAASLENVTESAYALQDAFDMDVAESSRAAKAMQENFGIAAEKAYDYIAKGAQDGLNYSGELLDNISEYSVQFAKLGLSADDMFTIFANGAENGAWNLDKIGDAVKEFSIRAIDGSDTTKKGFEALGFDAEDVAAKFAEGGETARAAFKTIVDALGAMDDPIKQNEAGVNLFGTMWEDLGVDAVKALGDISNSAYDCAGAMDEIKEVNYSSLSDALGGLQRQLELMIQPLGDSLIPIISDVIDGLSGMADEVIPELLDAITPVLEDLAPMIEPLMELVTSILPELVRAMDPVIESFSGIAQTVLPQLAEVLPTLLEMLGVLVETVLPPLAELVSTTLMPIFTELVQWFSDDLFPIVEELLEWLMESLMPVLAEIIERVMPSVMEILESLTPLLETLLDIMLPILDLVLELIDPIADILELVGPLVSMLLGLVNSVLQPLGNALSDLAGILTDVLGGALKFVSDFLCQTLIPAFEGLTKFLSGDFLGGIQSWGEAFEGAVSSVCSAIDGIFGTHLSEWYDKFRSFFREMGSSLYEMTHADEINEIDLQNKYGNLDNLVILRSNELMRGGMSAEQALSQAMGEIIDTAEKSWYWDQHFKDQVTVEETESRRKQMEENGTLRSDWYDDDNTTSGEVFTPGAWIGAQYASYAKSGSSAGGGSSGNSSAGNYSGGTSGAAATTEIAPIEFKTYTPASTDSSKKSSASSGKNSTTISVTSYVPTIWDNDQTAALKSLIGKDVLGNTTTAHQINDLTGAVSGNTTSASAETNLADVINAITRLQRKVEKFEDKFGDMTIELTADDMTIGKACVRDCNIMAKRSGKSPFNF